MLLMMQAGLSISEKMRASIKSMNQGMRNAQDGISMVQASEGAMNEVSDILTRMKELTVQGSNGTYNSTDLASMDLEYQALTTTISDIAAKTEFNGIKVLAGATNITIQTSGGATDQVVLDFTSADLTGLTFGGITTNAGSWLNLLS